MAIRSPEILQNFDREYIKPEFELIEFRSPIKKLLNEERINNIDIKSDKRFELNEYDRIIKFPLIKEILYPEIHPKIFDPYPLPETTSPTQIPASENGTLDQRLRWTTTDPKTREEEASRRRVKSSDNIRIILLDRYHRKGLDVLTQIRLIHRAHMKGNEHYLLYPRQAVRVVYDVLPQVDRLAGVIRSSDGMSQNIGLAGGLLECASFDKTPELMQQLADKAEELFPKDGINPKVNAGNIYHYLSAFQYYLALIHPFYEANGRTSEDAMYVLWKRRPDLAHTVRYVSDNGSRNSANVDERMRIINAGALSILRTAAVILGANREQANMLRKHTDLVKLLMSEYDMDMETIEARYFQLLNSYLENSINNMGTIPFIQDPVVDSLAENLRNSSTVYHSNPKFLTKDKKGLDL